MREIRAYRRREHILRVYSNKTKSESKISVCYVFQNLDVVLSIIVIDA